jgi:hypothetical protein
MVMGGDECLEDGLLVLFCRWAREGIRVKGSRVESRREVEHHLSGTIGIDVVHYSHWSRCMLIAFLLVVGVPGFCTSRSLGIHGAGIQVEV